MISVVCWKWKQEGNERHFTADHVNVLRAMVARQLQQPHTFICLTDDKEGLHPKIDARPLPVTGLEHLISPCQSKQERKYLHPTSRRRRGRVLRDRYFPSCYRRLWILSEQARELGDVLLQIDIDVVIGAALDPLIHPSADFVGWCDEHADYNKIAGGIFQLRAGTLARVWEEFDPQRSPDIAAAAGYRGSDQAWLSYKLYPPPARWTRSDGLLKINWAPRSRDWPEGARVIFTAGHTPPWDETIMRNYPWVSKHWRL